MTKKMEAWQIERQKRVTAQAKAMDKLTKDQLEALDKAYKAMQSIRSNIFETSDLYLSDIRELDIAFWAFYHAFNKGENENV